MLQKYNIVDCRKKIDEINHQLERNANFKTFTSHELSTYLRRHIRYPVNHTVHQMRIQGSIYKVINQNEQ